MVSADLTKHAEAILQAAFPSMNAAIIAVAAKQPAVATALTALADQAAREMREAGKQNWDGLARSIMMALDMGANTPRTMFQHLRRCGIEIPQWMRDEAEMKHLDHVPSKGTRAVLIYRAMTEDISLPSARKE